MTFTVFMPVTKIVWPQHETTVAALTPMLTWSDISSDIDSYMIYFGTSEEAVMDATTASSEYKGPSLTPSYTTDQLALDSEYFWRVDAVMADSSVIKGDVSSFFTAVTLGGLEDGLVVYWPFDEGAGTTAYDASGNSNNGTLTNGPVWSTDAALGGAIQFDGTNDKVQLNPFDGPLNSFTVSLWVKANTLGQNEYSGIFSNTLSSSDDGFQIDVDGGDPRNYRYRGKTYGIIAPVSTSWIHLALVCNGTRTSFYCNGSLISNYTEDRGEFTSINVGTNRNNDKYFNGIKKISAFAFEFDYNCLSGFAQHRKKQYYYLARCRRSHLTSERIIAQRRV